MKIIIIGALLIASSPALASKSCDELKVDITAKLMAKQITGYVLDIVPADKVGDKKVIGSCEGGQKKITYVKK